VSEYTKNEVAQCH